MKDRLKQFIILSMAVILIASGCGSAGQEENSRTKTEKKEDGQTQTEEKHKEGEACPELSEGSEARDFTADVAGGSSFTLSEKKNKVILLNFWASWCGPCVGEMPALQKLYEELGGEIEILAVNILEERDVVDAFIEESGYTFPIAYDEKGEISNKYPTAGIPYTVIIGKDGKASEIFVGSKGAEEQYEKFRNALDEALSK